MIWNRAEAHQIFQEVLLSSDSQGSHHLCTGGRCTWISPPVLQMELLHSSVLAQQHARLCKFSRAASASQQAERSLLWITLVIPDLEKSASQWILYSGNLPIRQTYNLHKLRFFFFCPSEIYEGTPHRTRGEIDPHAGKQEIQRSHLMHPDWT